MPRVEAQPEIFIAREVADTRDIESLARWLDARFVIPGTNWRFGLDGVIGLVPVVGDGVTALLSAYIILRARELGAPRWLLARMGANWAIDSVLGAVPLVGDIFDVAFKSNLKNLRLLQRHLAQRGPA